MARSSLLHALAVGLFASVFLVLDRTDFFPKQFPRSFAPLKSAAQITEGDLFGTCAPIEQLQALNTKISPILASLKQTPFFRTYKVNLERECPFWAQARLCNSDKCSICECDAKDVPLFWQVS